MRVLIWAMRKKQSSAQKVKGLMNTLKSEYKHGSLEVMDYLVQVSVFCKNYDD